MRTHIFITLLTLTLASCASKEHPTAAQEHKQEERQEMQTKLEYSRIDGSSGRAVK